VHLEICVDSQGVHRATQIRDPEGRSTVLEQPDGDQLAWNSHLGLEQRLPRIASATPSGFKTCVKDGHLYNASLGRLQIRVPRRMHDYLEALQHQHEHKLKHYCWRVRTRKRKEKAEDHAD